MKMEKNSALEEYTVRLDAAYSITGSNLKISTKGKNKVQLNDAALSAIRDLQANCGTHEYYIGTISRLSEIILNSGDEIGLSNHEAISILRSLAGMRKDLDAIATAAVKDMDCTDKNQDNDNYDPHLDK